MRIKYSFAESDLSHFITQPLVEWAGLFSQEKYEEIILIENSKFCIKIKEQFQRAQEELDAGVSCPENIGNLLDSRRRLPSQDELCKRSVSRGLY